MFPNGKNNFNKEINKCLCDKNTQKNITWNNSSSPL